METLEPRILLSAGPLLTVEPENLIATLVIEPTPEEPTITFEESALTSSGQALTGTESLDIDDNAFATEADGLLVVRYLFGLRGDALTEGLVDVNQSLRSDAQQIVDFLDPLLPTTPGIDALLDVDADMQANPMTDGQLILRFIKGLTGTDLTTGVVNPLGNRTDPGDIHVFLTQFLQSILPPAIDASLANDTGVNPTDGLTLDPGITGTIAVNGTITQFQATLDDPTGSSWMDVLPTLQMGNQFLLNQQDLESVIGNPLPDGFHTLSLRAQDDRGRESDVVNLSFTFDTLAPSSPVIQLLPSSDTGISNSDRLTSDDTPTLHLITESDATVTVSANGIPVGEGVAAQDGTIDLTLSPLSEGLQTLSAVSTDAAGNISSSSATFPLTIDTTGAVFSVLFPATDGTITPQSHVIGAVTTGLPDLSTLRYRFDQSSWHTVILDQTGSFDQALGVGGLSNGMHTLTLESTDQAGNNTTTNVPISLTGVPFQLTGLTPLDGATSIGVLVHPRLNFSEAVDPASLTSANFFATAGGNVLPANIVADPDGLFARLFFLNPMPGNSEVIVTVDGSSIVTATGAIALDADGNGIPGGMRQFAFTTGSIVGLPGTSIVGRIADAGPDLMPMTADDTLPGPDGLLGTEDDIILLPISGVQLFTRGLESNFTLTDSTGSFLLDAVPAGAVTLTMEGAVADAPTGFTFPQLNAELQIVAGTSKTIDTIYLPRLADAVVQTIDTSITNILTLPVEGAIGLTEEQRQQFTLEIAPGALLGPDGLPVSTAQVAMSVLPPETFMPFLPSSIPEPTLVFTTQLRGGATDIARPFRATLPNLDGALVGETYTVLSFDHLTGELVADGTAVAVADPNASSQTTSDLTAENASNPLGAFFEWIDEGHLVACVHFLIPSGGANTVDSSDCDPDIHPSQFVLPVFIDNDTFQDRYFDSDNGSFNLHFENAAAALNPAADPCAPENQEASPLKVEVTFEQPESTPFIDRLESQTFYLYPQESKELPVLMRRMLNPEDLDAAVANRLLGATVTLKGTAINPQGGGEIVLFDQELYVYRFWDIADDDHIDGTFEFEQTLADGSGGVTRNKPLELVMAGSAEPTLTANGAGFAHNDSEAQVTFNPSSVGMLGGGLSIVSPNQESVGTILFQGEAIPATDIVFSRTNFIDAVAQVVDANAILNLQWSEFRALFPEDSNFNFLRSDEPGFAPIANAFYDQIVSKVEAKFGFDSQVGAAVNVTESGGGVQVTSFLTLPGGNDDHIGESPWVDFNRSQFNEMVSNRKNTSTPQEQFLLTSFVNLSATDPSPKGYQGVALLMGKLAEVDDPATGFVTLVSNTLTHEVGHVLGMIHDRGVDELYLYGIDVMGSGSPTIVQSFGNPFLGLVKSAVGVPMSQSDFSLAVDYYSSFVNRETFPFSVPAQVPGEVNLEPKLLSVFDGAVVSDQPAPAPVSSVDFGTITADGMGGQSGEVTLVLFNNGEQDLTISDVSLLNGTAGFSVEGIGALPLILPAIDPQNIQPSLSQQAITVRFDPTVTGAGQNILSILSDSLDGTVIEIPLSGFGISPFGDINLDIPNNNVGGGTLSGSAVAKPNLATIRNIGASDLTITGVTINDGSGQFSVTGVPAGPTVLAPNDSLSFGVTFDAAGIGLQRAHLQITSNDPETPLLTQTILGTGLPDTGSALDYGKDYVAVQLLRPEDSPVQRQVSDTNGNWSVFLSSDRSFRHAIFDPVSGLIHDTTDITAFSGQTSLLLPVFHASTSPDSDGDGLPDDIEFAIGSSASTIDSDGDGLDDFTEIQAGLNPLDGVALPVGIIGGLSLPGEAWDIAFAGTTGYLATGGHGLVIADASNPATPIILATKALPGSNQSVAIDPQRLLAAVADNSGTPGLHILDVANPGNPLLLRTVPLLQGASHVEVFDGIAFVASGTSLVSVELSTGLVLQTLDLGGTDITGLAREGRLLVTMDMASTLRTIGISGLSAAIQDSLVLTHGGGGVFVGAGIAYATNESGLRGGFSTVDVSDPANIQLISDSDVPSSSRPDQAIAVDSAGRALVVGNAPNPNDPFFSINVADLADVTDPTDTNAFPNRFVLPDFPLGVTLGFGVGWVADSDGDLQIIRYQSADILAQSPTVTLSTTVLDADPNTGGIQVLAGTTFLVQTNAVDDVLVREVDLLVNGQLTATDGSFPYETFVTADTLGALTIQAIATDTSANTALSNVLTIQVIPDTIVPTIISTDPADGTTMPEGLQTVRVRFSEALDASTVTTNTFQVTSGGQPVLPSAINLLADNTLVELTYNGLSAGDYQLIISGALVTDLFGNTLAVGDVTSSFTLSGDAIEWINPVGGFWDDPNNWEGGILPGPTDNVLIDVAENVVITHQTGTTIINRLISHGSLTLNGGILDVTTTMQVDGAFTLDSGATLRNATVLPGVSVQDVLVPTFAFPTLDAVTLVRNLTIDDVGTLQVTNDLTLDGARLTLATSGSSTGILFGVDQALLGTGEIFFGGSTGSTQANSIDGTDTLTIGSGITIRGTESGAVGFTFGNQTIILEGTILADTSGETIALGGINTQITGLVHASNGGIASLRGSFSFEGAGTFHSDGGNVVLDGTLLNTGKTLSINSSTGSLFSSGGTIQGGRLEVSGGATLVPQSDVTLDTVTLGSNLVVQDGTTVQVSNGLTLDNISVTFTDGTVSFISPRLRFLNTGTLAGTGEIIFGGTGDSNQLTGTTGSTMTIGPDITIHGTRGGTVGGLGHLINQGLILSETNARQITVSGTTVTNQGTLEAINGGDILFSGGPFTNTDVINIGEAGSQVRLLSGTILQTGGSTTLAGGTLRATTVDIQGGTVSGFGVVNGILTNNGIMTIGGSNAAETLQVTGDFSQTAAGILNMEIGGVTAGDQFDQLTIGGTKSATLAGTLDLSLINAFTPTLGQNFEIISFGSHGATTFDTINGLALPNALMFDPQYNATNLTLVAVGSPLTGGETQSSGLITEPLTITQDSAAPLLASVRPTTSSQSSTLLQIVEELLVQPAVTQTSQDSRQQSAKTSSEFQNRSPLKQRLRITHTLQSEHSNKPTAIKVVHGTSSITKKWADTDLVPSPKWLKDFLVEEETELDVQITL